MQKNKIIYELNCKGEFKLDKPLDESTLELLQHPYLSNLPTPEGDQYCWCYNGSNISIEPGNLCNYDLFLEWLRWIKYHIIIPKQNVLNGIVTWEGDYPNESDYGSIHIVNNEIKIEQSLING